MRGLKILAFVVFISSSLAQAQPQADDTQYIKYFRDSKTGKPVEFEPEAAELIQNILVQQISSFCSKPENRRPGKCGVAASQVDKGLISQAIGASIEQEE